MKRTSAALLISAAVIGGAIGFGLDLLITSMSYPSIVPDIVLPILLVLLALGVVALAWPIRRARRDRTAPRVNPFRAVRVAVLARASSILGAGIGAWAVGLLLFALSRQVQPQVSSIGRIAATIVAGALLMVAALIAEHFCSLPKDDDDDRSDDTAPAGA